MREAERRHPETPATTAWQAWGQGLATGLALAAAVALMVLAGWVQPAFVGMYRDFGAELPFVTRLALHPAWAWGVPSALWLAALALNVGRHSRARLVALSFVALLGVGLVALGVLAYALPTFALSDGVGRW